MKVILKGHLYYQICWFLHWNRSASWTLLHEWLLLENRRIWLGIAMFLFVNTVCHTVRLLFRFTPNPHLNPDRVIVYNRCSCHCAPTRVPLLSILSVNPTITASLPFAPSPPFNRVLHGLPGLTRRWRMHWDAEIRRIGLGTSATAALLVCVWTSHGRKQCAARGEPRHHRGRFAWAVLWFHATTSSGRVATRDFLCLFRRFCRSGS